jgi:bifunctional non-homologous end joining protein LigD
VPVKKPKATWVEPTVEAEIEYGGLTDDGLLREAVFKAIRDDLRTVATPSIQPSASSRMPRRGGVPRENILQLLPDAIAPSKEELIGYWRRVGKRALHYLGRRPLKLVRHTLGTTFYHKGRLPPIPDIVHQLRIEKREGGEGVRVWVDDIDGLIGLVEMDAVELHPWAATVDDIERPDRLVLDLDPGAGVAWEFVVETALKLKGMLEDEGYESWPKLTGGKGLHLMAPIQHASLTTRPVCTVNRWSSGWKRRSRTPTPLRRCRRGATIESISTTCAMAAAQRRSAPIRLVRGKTFRWPRP